MSTRSVRVWLRDPDDISLGEIQVEVDKSDEFSDLDIRKQIADYIENDGRYYLYEDDSIFAADGEGCDYWATVQELRAYGDRCPNCGDQSEDTRANAVNAVNEGGRGICTHCGVAFKVAQM